MWLYKLTNKENGKQYIGTSINPVSHRISRHVYAAKSGQKGMAITCAIRKYGIRSFSVEVIGEAGTYESLLKMEAEAIREQKTLVPYGYNITEGGKGARRPCSQETRSRISSKVKGKIPWNFGKRNAVTVARYSRTRHVGGAQPGSKPWNLGQKAGPMPEYHKQKIAETMRRVRATKFWSSSKATNSDSEGVQ